MNVEAYIESGLACNVICRNEYLDRILPNTLCLFDRDSIGFDGSEANESIARVRSLQLLPDRAEWRGPVIVFHHGIFDYNYDTHIRLSP